MKLVFGVLVVVIGFSCMGQAEVKAQTQEERLRQALEEARKQELRARQAAEEAAQRAEEARRQAEEERAKALKALEAARRQAAIAINAAQKDKKSEFASTIIDLGTMVSDINKSVKFYTEAIGFKEVEGFEVPADFAKDTGLTGGNGFKVRVLVLGEGANATKLKLIEMNATKPKKNDNENIHTELGFRYLTIYIEDTTVAMKRLDKAGVKPIAKTPSKVPESIAKDIWLTIIRDPDGNLVELVGPKK